MATTPYTMQAFVEEVRAIVARGLPDAETLVALSEPLQRIIRRRDCLADVDPAGNPAPDRSFDIYRDASLTVRAVVWAAKSGAPPHNHNGWALEGVISGVERNRNYQRLDDGSEPWRARLEEVDPTVVEAGQTTALALPPNDIHAVAIPAGKTLAIHLYGLDLAKQWRYRFDPTTGEVSPFRT